MERFFKECEVISHKGDVYVLSDDKIEKGDWILRPDTDYIGQIYHEDSMYFYCSNDKKPFTMKDGCKKIIANKNTFALIPSIPNDFIMEYYKSGCTINKVLVKFEKIDWNFTENREQVYFGFEIDECNYDIRTIVRPILTNLVNNEIVIKLIEEEKKYNQKELIDLCKIVYNMGFAFGVGHQSSFDIDKWLENYFTIISTNSKDNEKNP